MKRKEILKNINELYTQVDKVANKPEKILSLTSTLIALYQAYVHAVEDEIDDERKAA